jgi:hypothetical protein
MAAFTEETFGHLGMGAVEVARRVCRVGGHLGRRYYLHRCFAIESAEGSRSTGRLAVPWLRRSGCTQSAAEGQAKYFFNTQRKE